MKKLFGLMFYICAFYQGKSFVIEIDKLTSSPTSSIKIIGIEESSKAPNTNITDYTIRINEDITEDNDIPITFEYYSNVNSNPDLVAEGTTTVCSADLDDFDGTVAAVLFESFDIHNDPPCPIKAGEYKQKNLFDMKDGEFGGLFDDSYRNSIKLKIMSNLNIEMEIFRDSVYDQSN